MLGNDLLECETMGSIWATRTYSHDPEEYTVTVFLEDSHRTWLGKTVDITLTLVGLTHCDSQQITPVEIPFQGTIEWNHPPSSRLNWKADPVDITDQVTQFVEDHKHLADERFASAWAYVTVDVKMAYRDCEREMTITIPGKTYPYRTRYETVAVRATLGNSFITHWAPNQGFHEYGIFAWGHTDAEGHWISTVIYDELGERSIENWGIYYSREFAGLLGNTPWQGASETEYSYEDDLEAEEWDEQTDADGQPATLPKNPALAWGAVGGDATCYTSYTKYRFDVYDNTDPILETSKGTEIFDEVMDRARALKQYVIQQESGECAGPDTHTRAYIRSGGEGNWNGSRNAAPFGAIAVCGGKPFPQFPNFQGEFNLDNDDAWF